MSRDSAADDLRFHGGMLAAAAMYFGRSRADWMDLSTGISPWAYPIPPFDTAIWRHLPDSRDLAQLEATAAKGFGVTDAEEVVAVPGSDIAIRLLGTIFANRSAALLPPSIRVIKSLGLMRWKPHLRMHRVTICLFSPIRTIPMGVGLRLISYGSYRVS